MTRRLVMTGKTYGKLIVLREEGKQVYATCECGSENKWYTRGNVMAGYTQSCGCLRNERIKDACQTHGKCNERVYNIWQMMKARCDNPTRDNYKWYGGRGITYCASWADFNNFYADMGNPPEGTELDRINNNGNYERENCRWISHKENVNNKG